MTYIRFPFAEGGDRDEVPADAQADNSISFQEGYPTEYELDPATNAGARRLERRLFNGLLNRISRELQQYQQFGFPEFIPSDENGGSAFPYSLGAFVRYDPGGGYRVYRSLVANNTALPTVTANWLDTGSYLTNASLPIASTAQRGVSQLSDSISSTSSSRAATSRAVKAAYDFAGTKAAPFVLVPRNSGDYSQSFNISENASDGESVSIGKTGSGADFIWPALDVIPDGANKVLLSSTIRIFVLSASEASIASASLYLSNSPLLGIPSRSDAVAVAEVFAKDIGDSLVDRSVNDVWVDLNDNEVLFYARYFSGSNVASIDGTINTSIRFVGYSLN